MHDLRIPEDDPRRDRDPSEPIQPPAEHEPEDPFRERPVDEPEDSPGRGEPERRDPGSGRPMKLAQGEAPW
jgi:hypothetical protein